MVSLLIVGGGTWLGYKDVQYEARELFDAQLARSARLILSMVQAGTGQINFSSIQKYLVENQLQLAETEYSEEPEKNDEELESGHVYETKLGFQIWDDLGNLVLKSPNIPITPISQSDNGFSNNYFLGSDWRVFSMTSLDGRYRCITAERIDVRNDLIGKISSDLLILLIILIPALSITMWYAINQGLSSLHNLASQIHRRGAEKLDSVSENNVPTEIQTIAGAINQLLARLEEALEREKRITSDAAHELRTPLAAVRLYAELAEKATNKEDRVDSIKHILLGIDRTTHLVDQLLALARLEPKTFGEKLKPCNLKQIVIEEAALLAPIAHRKNIEISVCESDDIFIPADEASLKLLIRNLLNNSISYTQEDGAVEISLSTDENNSCLIISDNGPGIPPEERQRVFERFYRAQNHETPGCGIGLSIVMRVVELHGATIQVGDPDTGSGLKVTVCLPNN